MIQIGSVLIEEFRGIRKLSLDFSKRNFAICGPNGTAKVALSTPSSSS